MDISVEIQTDRLLINPWWFTVPIDKPAMENLKVNWWTSECSEPEIEGTQNHVQEAGGEFRRVRVRIPVFPAHPDTAKDRVNKCVKRHWKLDSGLQLENPRPCERVAMDVANEVPHVGLDPPGRTHQANHEEIISIPQIGVQY